MVAALVAAYGGFHGSFAAEVPLAVVIAGLGGLGVLWPAVLALALCSVHPAHRRLASALAALALIGEWTEYWVLGLLTGDDEWPGQGLVRVVLTGIAALMSGWPRGLSKDRDGDQRHIGS